MSKQEFIFNSGLWLGEGKITFSASQEFLKFYTKWKIQEIRPGVISALQIVEMQGVEEHVNNTFTFTGIENKSFNIRLENNAVGSILGMGLRDENIIAWQFCNHETFEGFETYKRQETGGYFLHAEYGTSEQFRTIIEGFIWCKEC